ncbi:hypothetical protein [Sphingomonas baiyangensis]|uniref:SAM-dependent methyltransferase n=1 Tax=Sphingomonas baiyangensis TaxID=2572576 RepID=A0A4U1L193_9SPHN|nr:hypothetical protein [Sphingomonas baiyangensis]TKD50559.1 hypothetical protein FBR43_07120 [Sphingomonas baiyangensis]
MSRKPNTAYAKAQTVDHENGEEHGFYPTHPSATRALLSVESFDGPIWEPACGEGDLSRVLIDAGYDVVSTDLIDRGYGEAPVDFLRQFRSRAPNVCTNPPFHLAQPFVNAALQHSTGKVAMFLRLAFLEGQRRGPWFRRTPLRRVWVLSDRVPMQRSRIADADDRGGVLAFAWFVWEHGFEGAPTIDWIEGKPFR